LGSALALALAASAAMADTARDAYMRGLALERVKNYAGAGQEYKKSLTLDPHYAWSWRQIGNCYYYLGYKDKAVQAYDTYLRTFPQDAAIKKFADSLRAGARSGAQAAAPAAASREGVYYMGGWPLIKGEGNGHNFYISKVEFAKKEQMTKANPRLVTGAHTLLRNLKAGESYFLYMTTVRDGKESDPDYKGPIEAVPPSTLPPSILKGS
jgi:tetratricopeptide (TPR) repeat protein